MLSNRQTWMILAFNYHRIVGVNAEKDEQAYFLLPIRFENCVPRRGCSFPRTSREMFPL